MSDSAEQFVERLGLVAEEQGFPRIAGRMLGFLLLYEGPFSLDELAERLSIGKTSASTNARLLENLAILRRTIHPGDRRDYYQLADDHWEGMFDVARRRMQRVHDVLTEALGSLPVEMAAGRRRVLETQRFYGFMLEDVQDKLKRWRRYREQLEGESGAEDATSSVAANEDERI